MSIRKLFLMFFTILLFNQIVFSQEKFTLNQVIDIAKSQSPISLQSKNRKENRFWQYRTYLSNYKPQLFLEGTLPDYTRAIYATTQPDGSDAFRERSQINMNTSLSLSQTIATTGGRIFVSSQLARLNVLTGVNTGVTFLSNPVQIGFVQPFFAFNGLKWDKKIEPLRYEESQKKYNEDMEQISVEVTRLYFDLLIAQISYDFAQQNRANNDTIFRIGEGRYNMGKIAENDLLQLRLNVMNSSQQVSQAKLDIERSQLILKSYMGNRNDFNDLQLIEPVNVPEFLIDPETAIAQAKNNRERFINFKRQRLEAERDVAKAKGDNGLNVNLSASFGLTQNAPKLGDAYINPQDQQTIRVGFQIPVLDWGRQKSQIKTALANEELVKSTVSQNELTFEQEIYLKVKQLEILRERLRVGRESDEIAQRRYFIAQNRYLIDKISITDLNIALNEKDNAKTNYLSALREFWVSYYEIRQLTLYDFENNIPVRNE